MKSNNKRKIPEQKLRDRREDDRGEIKKLRKQVSQLQKENEKLRNRDLGFQDLVQEFAYHEKQDDIDSDKPKMDCPYCKSPNLKFLSLRGENSHFNCNECGRTGLVKNEE